MGACWLRVGNKIRQESVMKKRNVRNIVMVSALGMAAAGFSTPFNVQAQTVVKRVYGAPTQRFASAVWAGDTLYVAGQMASPSTPADKVKGTPAVYGDTEAQTASALTAIEKILKAQGLTLGDVVQMEVFLAGDPAKEGKMDFAGMNAAYGKFFGSAEQPNKPVRAAMQVAALASPWGLVEIMVVAVKSK
jgi:enamine deaminase RidA (YjgF/YER057c/UK114 family)